MLAVKIIAALCVLSSLGLSSCQGNRLSGSMPSFMLRVYPDRGALL
jgi:hypothetical protein